MVPPSSDAEPTLRGYTAGARVFGRFTLLAMLGRGGMGIVWRARDETLGGEVALKFLPEAVRWDPGAFEDLKAETRRARQLTHPNIVRIHDFVEDASGAALSMELVDGATLTALRLARERKVFEPADIAAWLPQLAAALDYAHREVRVVHRDLKPSNLMLTREGRLKVTDFGVARSLADSITRASMMSAGTLVYMSPQQSMGEDPAPADDIYALGATLYELLTGKPPFHTGDVRLQLFQRRPDSIAARRKALGVGAEPVPAAWERTIAACLAKQPTDRPASAGEVVELLTGRRRHRGRAGWRPARRAWVGGGALAACCLVGVALFVFRSGPAGNAPAPPATVFASDATRALAAWNFDGDGRDGSGRKLDLYVSRAQPTRDRFGRIGRALKFNGSAGALLPDVPAFRWSGRQPFTVAVWIRPEGTATTSDTLWDYRGPPVGSFVWQIRFSHGKPGVWFYRNQQEDGVVLLSPDRLRIGEWHHLALVSNGTESSLYVDGHLVAKAPLGRLAEAPPPTSLLSCIGVAQKTLHWSFTGALDDGRVWRRALAPAEIAALAAPDRPPRFALSTAEYSGDDDLGAAVRAEFGPTAQLADWVDLKRWWADDPRNWAEELEVAGVATLGWVQCEGRRRFDDRRLYFVDRFDGVKPAYYQAHDEIGGCTFALGSWMATRMPFLAMMPAPPVRRESLHADPGRKEVRREGGFGNGATAVELAWRATLTSEASLVAVVRLFLAEDRALQAVCETNTKGLACGLGPVQGGGLAHTKPPFVGLADFSLVARNRELTFRAVSVVGGDTVFHQTYTATDFRLAEVAALEVAGGPQSNLTAVDLVIE